VEVETEAAAPAPAPEVAAVPVITDIDEPESVPELSPEDLIEPVPELEPQLEPELEPVPELQPEPVIDETPVPTLWPLPEETIPLIEPEEGDPEPLDFDDELEAALDEPEEPADDEFGLDDFDLSEFDDLPSTEAEKSADKGAEKDTGPKPKNTPDNERKK